MFWSKSKKREAEINALSAFANEEWHTSMNNIKKGLVEIIESGEHSSNGLLITENGYFLTPKHCAKRLSKKSVRLNNGNEYGIEKLLAISKKEDIALVKARIPESCSPIKYNFKNEFKEKDIIALYTMIDGKLLDNYGFIYCQKNLAKTCLSDNEKLEHYKNQFMVNIYAKPGYSGSIIVNKDQKILGILSGGNCDDIHIVAGVRIRKAIELVKFYIKKLQAK